MTTEKGPALSREAEDAMEQFENALAEWARDGKLYIDWLNLNLDLGMRSSERALEDAKESRVKFRLSFLNLLSILARDQNQTKGATNE